MLEFQLVTQLVEVMEMGLGLLLEQELVMYLVMHLVL
jgi:hypothetical protein